MISTYLVSFIKNGYNDKKRDEDLSAMQMYKVAVQFDTRDYPGIFYHDAGLKDWERYSGFWAGMLPEYDSVIKVLDVEEIWDAKIHTEINVNV